MIHKILYNNSIGILGLLIIISGLFSCSRTQSETKLIEALNNTPILYTLEATTQICVESTDSPNSLAAFFGNRNIIIPVSANIKVGYDFSKITELEFIDDHLVEISLPDPIIEIESTKILGDEILTDVTGLRDSFTANEQAEIAQVGLLKIQNNLSKLDLVEPSRVQAQLIIRNMLKKMGFDVVFTDSDKVYSEDELKSFIR